MKIIRLTVVLLFALLLALTACAGKRGANSPMLAQVGDEYWMLDLDATAGVNEEFRAMLEEFGDEMRKDFQDLSILIDTKAKTIFYYGPNRELEMEEAYEVVSEDKTQATVRVSEYETYVFTLEKGMLRMTWDDGSSLMLRPVK